MCALTLAEQLHVATQTAIVCNRTIRPSVWIVTTTTFAWQVVNVARSEAHRVVIVMAIHDFLVVFEEGHRIGERITHSVGKVTLDLTGSQSATILLIVGVVRIAFRAAHNVPIRVRVVREAHALVQYVQKSSSSVCLIPN